MKLTVTHIVPNPSARPHAINGSCWCFPALGLDKEFGVSLSHNVPKEAKGFADAWVRVEQEVEL